MDYVNTLFSVEKKIIVITGGGGILGSAMANGFLQAGAKVVLLGRNEEKLANKIALLRKSNNDLIAIQCNVLDEESIQNAHKQILDTFKRIDVIINAAGGNMPGATIAVDQSVFDLKIDQFKNVMDLNLNGTVLPTLIFGKTMANQKSGSIINISSMSVSRAVTRVAGYSASKAAVDNFTRWMAVEMAHKFGDEIRVNAIAPGFLLTDQNRTLLTNADGSLTERGKTIINLTPFKRFGEPDELIGVVLWLASNASRFVTGTVIPIDGGFSAYSGV